MSGQRVLSWKPPGPVSERFMRSGSRVQGLNGPIGSGKTTTVLTKLVRLGAGQNASRGRTARNDSGDLVPVRQFRACCVRDTYRQLWKTTLPSWFRRFPKDNGFTGAENAPASHRINFQLPDRSILDFLIDFVAIGDNAAEDVLRGYEPTVFYLNEADLLAREVFTYARGRAGRFPEMDVGGPTFWGVLFDCNAPEFGSWLHEDFFTKSPSELAAIGVELFIQPSGLSPQAENLENLPPGYYDEQILGAPDWYVQRMIHNRPGMSRAGKPVYPEFSDATHVSAADLPFLETLPLLIGLDAALSPAAVFAQRTPDGKWRVLDELVAEAGTGAIRFGRALAQRLKERFPTARTITAWADPTAGYGVDRVNDEQDWMQIVSAQAEIVIRPAPSNNLTPRLEAVRLPLTRMTDGTPDFRLSPRCSRLRVGFNSGYRFRKSGTVGETYSEEPEKNEYSHPHDALQYVCLGAGENVAIRERAARRDVPLQRAAHVHDWDPFNVAAAS